MEPRKRIDAALSRVVEAREVPGVVAMAATDEGILYEGSFGLRDLGKGPAMTRDTVFRIASMTKAITSVAAMQLVEQGKLMLDQPIGKALPELAAPQVLEGFDDAGAPRLRPAKRPISLRHLLTHTAGFSYEFLNPELVRYVDFTGIPSFATGKLAALGLPLIFDPGERWEYGISTDWVGRIVEIIAKQPIDAYFREHIFAPLGMTDTGFFLSGRQEARLVSVHQRKPDGSVEPTPTEAVTPPEFLSGGGGLYSTGPDYLAFLQMLLHQGRFNSAQLLRPETVALMAQNHIGDLNVPELSSDVEFFPGIPCKWGLGHMINTQPGPNGRSAGSLTWGGIYNTFYWLDPQKHVAGVILTQILPLIDRNAVRLYAEFERGVYNALKEA